MVKVHYYDPQVPGCSLDLRINANYNGHTDWNKTFQEAVIQPVTVRTATKSQWETICKNRCHFLPPIQSQEDTRQVMNFYSFMFYYNYHVYHNTHSLGGADLLEYSLIFNMHEPH